MNTFSHFWQYLAKFFLEWQMFHIKVAYKIKTHILCSITFFREPCSLWDNMEKYGRAGEATDGNIIRRMRFARSITKATHTPTHTLRICNTYCFSTVTMVSRTRLIVTLYVHCLSSSHSCNYNRHYLPAPSKHRPAALSWPHLISTYSWHGCYTNTGISWLRTDRPRFCEHCNELLSSIKWQLIIIWGTIRL